MAECPAEGRIEEVEDALQVPPDGAKTETVMHYVHIHLHETVISEYLNFSTQSYFIKIFKKHTGMTPAQYRRYYREEESW